VSVFDTSSLLIGNYILTQAPDSAGFVGITSTVGIGSVRWLANSGGIKDTAIDNVYVSQVPIPSTWTLMLGGATLLGFAAKGRRVA
ncbi:MAG: PEP-CTERM sorting domain-containing protein, partial [Sulfuricaulis sp.]